MFRSSQKGRINPSEQECSQNSRRAIYGHEYKTLYD